MFLKTFTQLDKNQEGVVTFDQIFEFFEETPTLYARHVFTHVEAVDEWGTIEFGDFVVRRYLLLFRKGTNATIPVPFR